MRAVANLLAGIALMVLGSVLDYEARSSWVTAVLQAECAYFSPYYDAQPVDHLGLPNTGGLR